MGIGAGKQFTIEVANDYRRANGWELLYNTFNVTTLQDKWYFILYNKYSGLTRMYFYTPSSMSYIPSANITHALTTEGGHALGSPILNFAQNLVDVSYNAQVASTVEHWQVAPGTWYALQYELAYDSQTSSQSASSFRFLWSNRSTQITQIEMNGAVEGQLLGSVAVPGLNLALSSTITNTTAGVINMTGASDVSKLNLSQKLTQAFLGAAKGAMEKAGAGIVEGILNGIFGKNSATNTDNVALRLNANIKLTGTLQQAFLLSAQSFAFPGYNQAQTVGFAPAYNEPLGIVYLSNRPTIVETVFITPQTGSNGQSIEPRRQYLYQVDPASFQIIWNPSVLARASVSSVSEVVLRDSNGAYPMIGKRENIAGQYFYTGEQGVGSDGVMASILGARLVFRIVPNDGTPPTTIVKTFVANKATVEVITPPDVDQW